MQCQRDGRNRRSIRLRGYDYTRAGAYYVTVCTIERQCLFGDVVNGVMRMNRTGEIVAECWHKIPAHFHLVELDQFVIMPNHMHGIIWINDDCPTVGATHASPGLGLPGCGSPGFAVGARHALPRATHASPVQKPGPQRRSIGAIVGSFKSTASKRINQWRNTPGVAVWHRNYYERIIRDDRELTAIRQYIADNPARWAIDHNHPKMFDP